MRANPGPFPARPLALVRADTPPRPPRAGCADISSAPRPPPPPHPPRSAAPSLALEIVLYFGKLWDVVFWILTFLVMCWKGYNLPYPDDAYEMEFAYLFVYLLIEPPRLFLGSKGNKTLTSGPLYASVLLGAYVIFMHAYYVAGQTFITRCDYALNVVSLAFVAAQVALSVAQAAEFGRSR